MIRSSYICCIQQKGLEYMKPYNIGQNKEPDDYKKTKLVPLP